MKIKRIGSRIASYLLAILLVFSITATASAAEPTDYEGYVPVGVDATLDIDPIEAKGTSLVAWNFRLHAFSGVGKDGTRMRMKGYYGAEVLCKDKAVYYRGYTHFPEVKPTSATLTYVSDGTVTSLAASLDTKSFGTAKLSDGLYYLDIAFSNGHSSRDCLYVASGKPYAVYADPGKLGTREVSRSTTFSTTTYIAYDCPADVDGLVQDWVSKQGAMPANSLGLDEITYQYWDDGAKGRNDTQRWAKLAHEIVPDEYADDLPDSVKVLLLHDWMVENLSYDRYLTTVLAANARKDKVSNSQSRNFYYGDHSGKYSVWNTRTGICIDFSNILAIMCRELGIPCNVMSNKAHAWNVVWLDGRWHAFDITASIQRTVYGADTTKVDNADKTICYDGFDESLAKFSAWYTKGKGSAYGLDELSAKNWDVALNVDALYTKESIEGHLSLPTAQGRCPPTLRDPPAGLRARQNSFTN